LIRGLVFPTGLVDIKVCAADEVRGAIKSVGQALERQLVEKDQNAPFWHLYF
jgi:hypothetical protein